MTMNDACHLRRVRDSIPWRVWIVALIGFWERAAFWGLTAPWRKQSQTEFIQGALAERQY